MTHLLPSLPETNLLYFLERDTTFNFRFVVIIEECCYRTEIWNYRTQKIARPNLDIARRTPEIARLPRDIARKSPEIARLPRDIARKSPEIARLPRDIARKSPEIAHPHSENCALNLHSPVLSWRIIGQRDAELVVVIDWFVECDEIYVYHWD